MDPSTKGGVLAERTILVCDVCGDPATATVTIKADGRSLNKDLCQAHVAELVKGARSARRGRPRKLDTAIRKPRRGRPPGTAKSKTATRRPRKRTPKATAEQA
jgi:hypothetical protein